MHKRRMAKRKPGRKPIADKKERIVMFAEKSLIELNGGQDICKQELYLYLKERGEKIKNLRSVAQHSI